MDCQLLILTYPPDLQWLDYCLRSVQKYWRSNLAPYIIATPECRGQMPRISDKMGCTVTFEPQDPDHHRGQIFIKMNADKYIEAPLIMITDSDCLFTKPCSVEDFMNLGRPIVTMEAYASLIPRSIIPDQNCFANYKEVIGTVLHLLAEHEYMRRHPFLFYRDHIRDVRERIESIMNKPLYEVMQGFNSGYFSEFNLFAAYCRDRHPEEYFWQDIWSAQPPIIHQFHSHSQSALAGVSGGEVARILA